MISEPNKLTPSEAAVEQTLRGWCAELALSSGNRLIFGAASGTLST